MPAGMTLLDFVRYQQHLTGTKIGCREGDCGACTVLVGTLLNERVQYHAVTSCLFSLGKASGKHIVTIEGINFPGKLNPIQQAMADEGGTQCGFCTPGFIMSMAGYCLGDSTADKQAAIMAIDGNICRCTGYKPIERAAEKLSVLKRERSAEEDGIDFVVRKEILPAYFQSIKERLIKIQDHLHINADSHLQEDHIIIGGGTDLYVQKNESMPHARVRFPNNLNKGDEIIINDGNCFLPGNTSVTALQQSHIFNTLFPRFREQVLLVSSTPIRNMATVAGNFVNASPIGDLSIFFLALDATLHLHGSRGSRSLPLRQFFKGYKQLDKTPDEIISGISFRIPGDDDHFNFEKVSKRTHLDIASVNTAMMIKVTDNIITSASIAAGGVAPVPLFLAATSASLTGQKLTEQTLMNCLSKADEEISPISDARGTAAYKRLLLRQLITAHFIELFPIINWIPAPDEKH